MDAAWLYQDRVVRVAVMLAGPIFILSRQHSWIPRWYSCLWLCVLIVYAPLNIYALLRHKELYLKYRLWSIAFLRLAVSLCFVGLSRFVPVPEATLPAILGAILMKSPTMTMVFMPVSLRLPFRHHVVLQSLAFCIALLWIPSFCEKCSASPDLAHTFHQVGYGVDWLFSYALFNSSPDPVDYPCWMTAVLLMVTIAFALPTFFVFTFEISSRAIFLKSKISQKHVGCICDYADGAFRTATLASLSLVVGTWFGLSLLRNAFYT